MKLEPLRQESVENVNVVGFKHPNSHREEYEEID